MHKNRHNVINTYYVYFLKNKFSRISVSLELGETGVFQKLPQRNAIAQYKCMKKYFCLQAENERKY
jgi:hypothetical protein